MTAVERDGRDEGSALVIALVMILLAGLMVMPILDYSQAVSRQTRILQSKTTRLEAVKGGLRTALADPVGLFKTCDAAGLTVPVNLAGPGLGTAVSTQCWKMSSSLAEDPSTIRYGSGTTQVGAAVPAGVVGPLMPGSGAAPPEQWTSLISSVPSDDRIWVPDLPSRHVSLRSPTGYSMPVGYPACTVYFPGTYPDPITIDGATPVYFTSGIYYFQSTVRFSGDANVVIGAGSAEGCTTDQEAAFYATNAPTLHNISGLGATFVLGAAGRVVVDDATAGAGAKVTFNKRYVGATDVTSASSAGVSIVSVNGELSSGTLVATDRAGVLRVPSSNVAGEPPSPATAQGYTPSTLVTDGLGSVPDAIVAVNLTTPASVRLTIPGYVSVPQGRVLVATSPGATANKQISIGGGVLAATLEVSPDRPSSFALGLVNPVVLQTLKIVSTTTTGTPRVTSTAIVQVKENGAYAINSWETQ